MFPRLIDFVSDQITETDIASFIKKYEHVTCYPWKEGLAKSFPEVETFSRNGI